MEECELDRESRLVPWGPPSAGAPAAAPQRWAARFRAGAMGWRSSLAVGLGSAALPARRPPLPRAALPTAGSTDFHIYKPHCAGCPRTLGTASRNRIGCRRDLEILGRVVGFPDLGFENAQNVVRPGLPGPSSRTQLPAQPGSPALLASPVDAGSGHPDPRGLGIQPGYAVCTLNTFREEICLVGELLTHV